MTRIIKTADPEEVEAVLWDGFGGGIGWDIGANMGQSIHKMAPMFDIVHSFEPAVECQEELNRVAKLYDNVHVHMIAVSDTNSEISLVDAPDRIETGQLVSYEAAEMEYSPFQIGHSLRTVEAKSIDVLAYEMGQPDFIKIDVEGHEGRVIMGGLGTLAMKGPDMLIEIHSREIGQEINGLLEDYGYDVYLIRHPHYVSGGPGLERLWDVHYWLKASI